MVFRLLQRLLRAEIHTAIPELATFKDQPLKWLDTPARTRYPSHSAPYKARRKPEGEEALKLYEAMRMNGVKPGIPLVLAALKACTWRGELLKMYEELVKSKDDRDTTVSNTLIDVFAKCGDGLRDARRIFDCMEKRDIISYNTMIKSYVQNGDPTQALDLFSRIQEDGLLPNPRTYLAALNACTLLAGKEEAQEVDGKFVKAVALNTGRSIHQQLLKYQHESDMFVSSALVDMYSKCGCVGEARKVFDKMEHRDVVSWTAIIVGYANNGHGELALELYTRMKEEGFIPDARTFVAVFNACSSMASKEQWKVVDGKRTRPINLEKARALHSEMEKIGVKNDVFLESALVDMYCKCGNVAEAKKIFDRICRPDAVSWTSMILGYAEYGDGEQALQLFARMKDAKVKPDSRTYVGALAACGSLACKEGKHVERKFVKSLALKQGAAIHSQLVSVGLDSNLFVANALLDMYSKCGSMENAEQVFRKLVNRDTVSWNSIISGYAHNEQPAVALKIFSSMQHEGFRPNALTLVAVFKACGSLVALESGRRLHVELRNRELEKDPRVSSSLVDFYGKCGSMSDAQEVFDSLETRDTVTWNALLGGYSSCGDTNRVFELFNRMQEQEVNIDGVTLLNLLAACSHSGLVDAGKELFEDMSSKYGVSPEVEHFTCMVDLLARANHLDEAVRMVKRMPYEANFTVWLTILGACHKWNKVDVGRTAFEAVVGLDETVAPAYSLMANLYSAAGMWKDCEQIKLAAKKRRTTSKDMVQTTTWVDNSGVVHRFSGATEAPRRDDIIAKLRSSIGDDVLHVVADGYGDHSELLAVGCALLNSPPGLSIRIAKNSWLCTSCHSFIARISKTEQRALVCSEPRRFHVFKDGQCSCGGE